MKKLLLSLFMSVMACLGAVAQTTVTAEQLSAAIGKAETISGYTFDIEKNNGSTAPSLHAGTNAIRLYAKGTLKISGDKLTKIVIKLASDASYRYTTFEPSVGALNPAQAAGDTEIVWEGDATEVTFTVGDKATMGTDGDTKAGQIRFASVEIYGEGGETPVDPTPGPGEDPDPVDPQGGVTFTAEQLSAAIGASANLSGYTFDIQKNNGSTTPQMNKTNLRIYAKGSMSVSGKKLTKIVVTLASDASFRYTTFEPSVGVLNPAQAAGDTEIVWEGDATEVTFTVGDNATMGTDGETKAGQIRLASVTIYGEPGEGGDTPVVPTPDEKLILSADFETSDGGFTFADNVFGDNKNVWQHDTSYGYMKASAYAGGANAVEGAYLVSPVMDLTNRHEIVLTFKHALGHAKTLEPAEMLSLWVREENMDWSVELPIQAWPSYEGVSGNFTKFAEAGEYDLDQFTDKKIQLGWKYTSTDAAAPTWEIDAVKVVGEVGSAISDIEADVNAPVEYFNLQGVRVANPQNGLYIMRQGNKVTKVIR